MKHTDYASYFDHTLLKQTATATEISQLCAEAMEFSFFSVCVNPFWIKHSLAELRDSSVKLCTVVGFPLGANDPFIKIKETELALQQGAQEIDCVLNVGALKSHNTSVIEQELRGIVELCKHTALVKVIVESGVLNNEELLTAISLVNNCGAEFIKTSTGFAAVGATPEAVQAMKAHGRPGLQIKASGGIKTAEDFKTYVQLGATRIGASQSVSILKTLLDPR